MSEPHKTNEIVLIYNNYTTPKKDRVVSFGGNFALQLNKSGTRAFITRFRDPKTGKNQIYKHKTKAEIQLQLNKDSISLSKYIDELKKDHTKIKGLVASGINPNNELQKAKDAAINAKTVNDVWELWLEEKETKKLKDSTLTDYKNRFRKHIKPTFEKIDITKIESKDCISLLRKIKNTAGRDKEYDNKGHRTAAICLNILNNIFEQAVSEGLINSTEKPTNGIKPSTIKISSTGKGKRVLNLEEITEFLELLQKMEKENKINMTTSRALFISTLTGLRRQEVTEMKKEHLTLNPDCSASYVIPTEVMKSAKSHTVHLTPFSIQLIAPLLNNKNSDYVFYSTDRRRTETNGKQRNITKNALNNAIGRIFGKRNGKKLTEIEYFSPHDLRRSFATGLQTHLNAPEELIHKMIAHGINDKDTLTEIYMHDQKTFSQESLWQSWSDLISQCLSSIPNDN